MAATRASPVASVPVRKRAAAYPPPHSTRQSVTPGEAENCAAVSLPLVFSLAERSDSVMAATVRSAADNRLPESIEVSEIAGQRDRRPDLGQEGRSIAGCRRVAVGLSVAGVSMRTSVLESGVAWASDR